MTDLSLWDNPADDISRERLATAKRIVEAGVEPLWPFLSQARDHAEFEHRLAVSGDSLSRAASYVPETVGLVTLPQSALVTHALASLRERFNVEHRARGQQMFHEAVQQREAASGGWLEAARGVVERHQYAEVEGVALDYVTANMLVTIYDALKEQANKDKFAAMPLVKAVNVGWQLAKPKAASNAQWRTAVGENGQCQQVNDEGVQCVLPAGHSSDEHDFPDLKGEGKVTASAEGGWEPLTGADLRAYLAGDYEGEVKMVDGKAHRKTSTRKTADMLQIDGVGFSTDKDGAVGWMSDWGVLYDENGWVDKGYVTSEPHNSGGLGGASYRLTDAGRAASSPYTRGTTSEGAKTALMGRVWDQGDSIETVPDGILSDVLGKPIDIEVSTGIVGAEPLSYSGRISDFDADFVYFVPTFGGTERFSKDRIEIIDEGADATPRDPAQMPLFASKTADFVEATNFCVKCSALPGSVQAFAPCPADADGVHQYGYTSAVQALLTTAGWRDMLGLAGPERTPGDADWQMSDEVRDWSKGRDLGLRDKQSGAPKRDHSGDESNGTLYPSEFWDGYDSAWRTARRTAAYMGPADPEGFVTEFGALKGLLCVVRTTNGGEVTGRVSTQGSTYPMDVEREDGTWLGLSGWRVHSIKPLEEGVTARRRTASDHDTRLPGGHLGDEEPKFEVVVGDEVRGQYGTREDAEDKVRLLKEDDGEDAEIKEISKAAAAGDNPTERTCTNQRCIDYGARVEADHEHYVVKTSALEVCPECQGDTSKDCPACGRSGVKRSAVNALLMDAAFFHAPQAPNASPFPKVDMTPAGKPERDMQQAERARREEQQTVQDEAEARRVNTQAARRPVSPLWARIAAAVALRREAEDIQTRLDGLTQRDDNGAEATAPLSTRPRVMPSGTGQQAPAEVAGQPDMVGQTGYADPGSSPMAPTVGQRLKARHARIATRIRADNPGMSDEVVNALATRTLRTYPEMMSTEA